MMFPHKTTNFRINLNTINLRGGDDVRLLDKSGVEIDKYTYGNSAYDKSWIRLPNGGAWQTSISSTPTPGASN